MLPTGLRTDVAVLVAYLFVLAAGLLVSHWWIRRNSVSVAQARAAHRLSGRIAILAVLLLAVIEIGKTAPF